LKHVVVWGAVLALLPAPAPGSLAEELRDPFTFGPRGDAGTLAAPLLVGVLWDATHPLAMVGEEAVGAGDVIAGWEVVEIQPDGVVVQRGERRALIRPGERLPTE